MKLHLRLSAEAYVQPYLGHIYVSVLQVAVNRADQGLTGIFVFGIPGASGIELYTYRQIEAPQQSPVKWNRTTERPQGFGFGSLRVHNSAKDLALHVVITLRRLFLVQSSRFQIFSLIIGCPGELY